LRAGPSQRMKETFESASIIGRTASQPASKSQRMKETFESARPVKTTEAEFDQFVTANEGNV